MRKVINRHKKLLLLLPVLFAAFDLDAQEKYPVPAADANHLFYLQRTPNTNTIVYELNYKNKILNIKDPVHAFWIRYSERGQKAELNYMQRRFAYGIKSSKISKDKYKLHLASYKKFPMILTKGADDKYNVYATINQKRAILNRIFVKINGGSFWSPKVEYVEIKGIDPATGAEVMERLKI